jgi:cytoskeletal protein CcmA (bactofilin family)
MSIANLKSKIASVVQSQSTNDNSISRKLEVISSSFKNTPTIIARDLEIEGEVRSNGVIEIEGKIKGIIKGNSVILREGGFVDGIIIAELLNLRGEFEGKIKAKNINISSKARIHGEIEYESLSVEDGACIDGQFKKITNDN